MSRRIYTVTFICVQPARPAALAEVVAGINEEKDLPLEIILFGHESSELADSSRLQFIGERIAASDLVLLSHIFLDEESAPLCQLVREHTRPDATVVAISSAGPVMRLTRIGKFTMGGKSAREKEPPPIPADGLTPSGSLFRRLLRSRDITPYLKEMIIHAPRLLKLLPGGRMLDMRTYLECYLAMIEVSSENLRSMLLMFADRTFAPLRGRLAGRYAAPIVYPAEGIYHPDAPGLFGSRDEYLLWYSPPGAVMVGLVVPRTEIVARERAYIDAVVRTLEKRGIGVIPAFGSTFDHRVAIEKMMLDDRGKGIDAILSLTAFPLVGGHSHSDAKAAAEALGRYDVPYFSPLPLLFQTIEQWRDSDYGISPVQTALHVALPELDGAIEPLVTSGMVDGPRGKIKAPILPRIERLVERVERWTALRTIDNSRKKIAVTIFSFPPSRGSVGTAAYLDVFRSLFNTLARLKQEGYSVELPLSPEAIIEDLVIGDEKRASQAMAELNVAGRLTVEEYRKLAPESSRVTKQWGAAPGNLNTDGRDLLIHGVHYGNIFIGVQPSFGYEGDPMRLLFAKGSTPHHGFLAYYTWISKVYHADAHLHFGTHGALEFMPGKQVGLDERSWPDLMIGDLPNIYCYAINNPSEGTIAKRRSLATLVSYLTPPLENAGLYRELSTLKSMIADYRDLPEEDPRREMIYESLQDLVEKLSLGGEVRGARFAVRNAGEEEGKDVGSEGVEVGAGVNEEGYVIDSGVHPPAPFLHHAPRTAHCARDEVAALFSYLIEIETRMIPNGLHTIGEVPTAAEVVDLIEAVAEHERPESGVRSLSGLVAESRGQNYLELFARADRGDPGSTDEYRRIRAMVRRAIEMIAGGGDSKQMIADLRALLGPSGVPRQELEKTVDYLRDIIGRVTEDRELDSVVHALGGGYIPSELGSDPVRNPLSLPSGRNIHALDPGGVPSYVAQRNARRTVELMLARRVEQSGALPESIGMILWGLDNIKTGGEAIAQAFALIGVQPRENSVGRMTRLEVIPLEILGRPRIDITIQASGIFRDIFGLQIELLDDAIRMVAALDEPDEKNFVRKHVHRTAGQLGISHDDAATRIFSNAPGAYGANVDMMVGMSQWEDRGDLADLFLKRKTFAYGRRKAGRETRRIFEHLASGIDTTFQNLDSSEIGITDVDHYFEYLGGLTAVVERSSGTRPLALVADTTTARGKVRTLEETIRLEARTKILNPKWSEGMLSHGYQGVEEIRKRLDYTFGFSATADAVPSWVYQLSFETYCDDPAMRDRMRSLNVYSYGSLVRRLLEAERRGFWQPQNDALERLRALDESLEDQAEGLPV